MDVKENLIYNEATGYGFVPSQDRSKRDISLCDLGVSAVKIRDV